MRTLLLIIFFTACISVQAQVAINTDGTSPDNSAMLDVKSTTRGLLAPRMTLVQRNAIVTPATGLIVFQTNGTPGYYYNSGTPAAPVWTLVGSNAGQWLNNGTNIYYNSGNVGIGTDTPLEKLHVNGYFQLSNTVLYPFIKFNNSFDYGNSGLEFNYLGANRAWIYYSGADNLLMLNADNEGGYTPDLVVKHGGNIGLGTLTPTARLHVIENSPGFTGTFGTTINAWTTGTNVAIGNDNDDAVLYVGQNTVNKGFLLWQYNADPTLGYYSIGTFNGSNNLVLGEYGGNVGIEVSSPLAKLHVNNTANSFTGLFGDQINAYSNGTNITIGDNESSSVLYLGQAYNSKGYLIWSYNETPANAYFSIGTFSGNNPLILQGAGGNVGIGTTLPNSRLQVDVDNNGHSYVGYSSIHTDYVYHMEQTADGVGQANIYALRTRNAQNDGAGYAYNACNSAIKGYSFWGDLYTFGTSGFNYNDLTRCGGVIGSQAYGNYWGALGYKNSGGTSYGGYFTSYTSGAGKSSDLVVTGIGIGAWGELMGADIHGKVYGIYAEGENYAMFTNGDVYKNKLDVHLQDNGAGINTVLYTNVSTDVTVQTCGVAILTNGNANIAFDPAFTASVSAEAPVIVTVTPIGNSNGVYLAEVSGAGFKVVENNAGKSNVTVNYIAIGKRAGYENPNLPREVIDPGYTGKMASGLHNDAVKETNGNGLFYGSGQLVAGIHPPTLPDPEKPAIETIIPKPSTPSDQSVKNLTKDQVSQLPENDNPSGLNGNATQTPVKAPVRVIPDVESAGSGKGKYELVQPAVSKADTGEKGSASERSNIPIQPSKNK